jgi:hypothetical protein
LELSKYYGKFGPFAVMLVTREKKIKGAPQVKMPKSPRVDYLLFHLLFRKTKKLEQLEQMFSP